MTDPRILLAHYVKTAAATESDAILAERWGLHKNYIHRAIHPNGLTMRGRRYSPVVTDQAARLLEGLGLTLAPVSLAVPTVGYINSLIEKMDAPQSAKRVARAAVCAAGLAGREEE